MYSHLAAGCGCRKEHTETKSMCAKLFSFSFLSTSNSYYAVLLLEHVTYVHSKTYPYDIQYKYNSRSYI